MKIITSILLTLSVSTSVQAQTNGFDLAAALQPRIQPVYPVPQQPAFGAGYALPVPEQVLHAPFGYSVVTETKQRPNPYQSQLYDRDIVDSQTVTTIVPNNFMGGPQKIDNPWD